MPTTHGYQYPYFNCWKVEKSNFAMWKIAHVQLESNPGFPCNTEIFDKRGYRIINKVGFQYCSFLRNIMLFNLCASCYVVGMTWLSYYIVDFKVVTHDVVSVAIVTGLLATLAHVQSLHNSRARHSVNKVIIRWYSFEWYRNLTFVCYILRVNFCRH